MDGLSLVRPSFQMYIAIVLLGGALLGLLRSRAPGTMWVAAAMTATGCNYAIGFLHATTAVETSILVGVATALLVVDGPLWLAGAIRFGAGALSPRAAWFLALSMVVSVGVAGLAWSQREQVLAWYGQGRAMAELPLGQAVPVAAMFLFILGSYFVVQHRLGAEAGGARAAGLRWLAVAYGIAGVARLVQWPMDVGLDLALGAAFVGTADVAKNRVLRELLSLGLGGATAATVLLAAWWMGRRQAPRHAAAIGALRAVTALVAATFVLYSGASIINTAFGSPFGIGTFFGFRWTLVAFFVLVAGAAFDRRRLSPLPPRLVPALVLLLITVPVIYVAAGAAWAARFPPAAVLTVSLLAGGMVAAPAHALGTRFVRGIERRMRLLAPGKGLRADLYRASLEASFGRWDTPSVKRRLERERRGLELSRVEAEALQYVVEADLGGGVRHRLRPGDEILPGLVVRRHLGDGSSAAAFEAVDVHSGEAVAVKLLDAGKHQRRHVRSEVRALSRLDHPVIPQFLGVKDTPYGLVVMTRRSAGRPVAEVAHDQALSAASSALLAMQLFSALHHAHRQGILHGDVSPHNILIDGSGACTLIDFGLSSTLQEGSGTLPLTHGTRGYIAPEVLAGGASGPAADVYGAGRTIAYALLGQRALGMQDKKVAAEAPAPWRPLLRACLAAEPKRRPDPETASGLVPATVLGVLEDQGGAADRDEVAAVQQGPRVGDGHEVDERPVGARARFQPPRRRSTRLPP